MHVCVDILDIIKGLTCAIDYLKLIFEIII